MILRNIVLPGEIIAEKPSRIENGFVSDGRTYSKALGIYENGREVIPLEGAWEPHVGDLVVGIVDAVKNKVYEIELSYFKRSILIASKFDTEEYSVGDIIQAEIRDIENRKTIILEMPRLLREGTILKVKPTKVPRIIGKASTMVKQIADASKCQIVVGVNGVIWLRGGDVQLAAKAILQIEREAHIPGLTERIKLMLEQKGN